MKVQDQPDLSPKFQVNQSYIVKILIQKNKERKAWAGVEGRSLLYVLIGGGALKQFHQSLSNERFA